LSAETVYSSPRRGGPFPIHEYEIAEHKVSRPASDETPYRLGSDMDVSLGSERAICDAKGAAR